MYLKGLRCWTVIFFSEIDFILTPTGEVLGQDAPGAQAEAEGLRPLVCAGCRFTGCARTACQAGPGSGRHHLGPGKSAFCRRPRRSPQPGPLSHVEDAHLPPRKRCIGRGRARLHAPGTRGRRSEGPGGGSRGQGQGPHGREKRPKADGVNAGAAAVRLCAGWFLRGGLLPTLLGPARCGSSGGGRGPPLPQVQEALKDT